MLFKKEFTMNSLNKYLEEYRELNSANEYKPVAVGRYGIRLRENIYSKELAKDYSKNKVIRKGTLTVGMGSVQIDIGILSDEKTYSVSPAYHTYKIQGIDYDYLRYCLQCRNRDMFLRYVKRGSRQGKSIDLKRWLTYKIPVYSPDVQKELVEKLDKVKDIIDKRKKQLEELENLVNSRFVEMFGDPIINDKEWNTWRLEEVCKKIVDCPHSTPSYTTENTGFMCIRTSIVKKNKILWDDIEYISEDEFIKRTQRKKPEIGDIVYTREGAILGIAAIIDREYNVALGQRAMLLSPNHDKCVSEFLCVAMNRDSFLNNVLKGISGSASPHINVGDIRNFKMIIPPINLQNQFAAFVHQVNKSKFEVQKSLEKTQLLFDSLMQEYFG